jgi:D-sedoheptulose 7-phosphate isomerase
MDAIEKHITQVTQGLSVLDRQEMEQAAALLRVVREWGGVAYLFGNGGSAATASHFANDLLKMAKLKAVCLSDAFPVVSAYGNDGGWENMYLDFLKTSFDYQKDCAVGITCSGNSENVVRAVEWVHKQAGLALVLTGDRKDSKIGGISGLTVVRALVPDIRVQEDLHSVVCHALARALQEE